LNYGRIVNNVRLQDARFQELVVTYQQMVLQANEEVEDGLVTYLRAHRRTELLDESVTAAHKAVKIVVLQYQKGAVDFNRYRGDRAEPGHAARFAGAGPRADRSGIDCRVPSDGRRLGDAI